MSYLEIQGYHNCLTCFVRVSLSIKIQRISEDAIGTWRAQKPTTASTVSGSIASATGS